MKRAPSSAEQRKIVLVLHGFAGFPKAGRVGTS